MPAILPALVAGLVLAWWSGELAAPTQLAWTAPSVIMPQFSLRAIITAIPVMVVLITLQANIPSAVFLRSQGYTPPERTLSVVSGLGTVGGSLLGPLGVSLSLPATALCAGPDAGERSTRHRAVSLAAGGSLVIALFAGLATELATVIPQALLVALVGLAVVGVLSTAIQRVAEGPLLLDPVFAFGIAVSELSMFGVGPFFWALVAGVAVSRLLERERWATLRHTGTSPA